MKKNFTPDIVIVVLLICFLSVIAMSSSFAQRNIGGIPLSFGKKITFEKISKHQKQLVRSKKLALPKLDNKKEKFRADSIQLNYCANCKTMPYGRGIEGRIDVKTFVSPKNIGDSLNLWLFSIESQGAYGMQFYFEDYYLPDGARLYIYNDERTQILGAFTNLNNPEQIDELIKFGTQWISGDLIHFEYQEPINSKFDGEVALSNIVHVFSDVIDRNGPYALGDPGSCQINVQCPTGSDWAKEISSVALILQYNSSNSIAYLSSGSLINSTSSSVSKTPLFLTARHIAPIITSGQSAYNPRTYTFLFNHQATSCSSDGSGTPTAENSNYSVNGSQLVAGYAPLAAPSADFLLLELNESMSWFKDRELSFNGWSKLNYQSGDLFAGIHHPKGDVKKISLSTTVNSSDYYPSVTNNVNGDHWRLKWSAGVTSRGSSGSPLFDEDHRIIGQLHGGTSACHPDSINNEDYYGKLYTAMTTDNDFKNALDPINSGALFVDSYSPHLDDDAFSGACQTSSTLNFSNIENDGFYLNSQDMGILCDNTMVFINANDGLLLETKGNNIWDLSYPTKSKFDLTPNNSNCNADDGQAFHCTGIIGSPSCRCYWAEIHVELKEYNYYLDLSSESTLLSDWISIGYDHLSSTNGLVNYQWGQCDVYKLYVQSFYLDHYLPVSLQPNKVYSLKLRTERVNGLQEKSIWIDTHSSDLVLSGSVSNVIASKNILLNNCTLPNGTSVYYQNEFEIQGTSYLNINCNINIDQVVSSNVMCISN